MTSKTAKTIPLAVVFSITAMTMIQGIEGIPVNFDFTPMYYLIAVTMPSSAAFGILTKVFKNKYPSVKT